MRFFAGMHVPRCHVNTTLSNTIFSREYQLFACWLKMFFWIRVEKSMLSVHLVLEICGLKVVVSFNFAPSAPHVKRRVKSCEPRAAAASLSGLARWGLNNMDDCWRHIWIHIVDSCDCEIIGNQCYFRSPFYRYSSVLKHLSCQKIICSKRRHIIDDIYQINLVLIWCITRVTAVQLQFWSDLRWPAFTGP